MTVGRICDFVQMDAHAPVGQAFLPDRAIRRTWSDSEETHGLCRNHARTPLAQVRQECLTYGFLHKWTESEMRP